MKKLQLTLAILFFGFHLAFSQIRITEIMYNPPEPGIDTLEYIEIQNVGLAPVSLEGYSFTSGPTYSFPTVTLPSLGYLIVCKSAAYFQNVFGSLPILEWTSGALSNTGMTITLSDQFGNTVTSVSYTNASPWPGGPANGNGASIVLCDPAGDNNNPDLWKSAATKSGKFHYGVELLVSPLGDAGCISADNKALILTGVFDAQPSNAGAKGVEIYVSKDVADLSIYGIGSANNGGGSDGIEFIFPAISLSSGQFLYAAADSALFHDYFGFKADFITDAMNINGDDAIELFESGEVIDVFGDINVDGTGQAWEYLDGWAYRIDGTGPDGNTFELSNWYFSGVGGLSGSPTNQGAPIPFPIKTYKVGTPGVLKANDDNYTLDFNTIGQFAVLANDVKPDPIVLFEIINSPLHGQAAIAGDAIFYQPNQDYCGADALIYRICDQSGTCDTASVLITVICPKAFPKYPVSLVRTVNAEGVLDSIGVTCELEGVVYGVNLRPGGLQFVMIDGFNDGITVFSNSDLGYSLQEGDLIVVRGTIAQFNGLAQIQPESVQPIGVSQPLFAPTTVSQFDENIESQLVRLEQVTLVNPAQWTNMSPGFNVDVTDGNNVFIMRIDSDVDVFGEAPPSGSFRLTGLGTQFDSSSPFTEGYQILPRYKADIELISSTQVNNGEAEIHVWPNPASNKIFLQSTVDIISLQLSNAQGQVMDSKPIQSDHPQQWELKWQGIAPGYYFILIQDMNGNRASRPLIILD
jgi:hypothetical protein